MCWYHRHNKLTMACADILLDRSLSTRKLLLAMMVVLACAASAVRSSSFIGMDPARPTLADGVLQVDRLPDLTPVHP
jgi:hypothetical protein